jgi:hypothetical protein
MFTIMKIEILETIPKEINLLFPLLQNEVSIF